MATLNEFCFLIHNFSCIDSGVDICLEYSLGSFPQHPREIRAYANEDHPSETYAGEPWILPIRQHVGLRRRAAE